MSLESFLLDEKLGPSNSMFSAACDRICLAQHEMFKVTLCKI